MLESLTAKGIIDIYPVLIIVIDIETLEVSQIPALIHKSIYQIGTTLLT